MACIIIYAGGEQISYGSQAIIDVNREHSAEIENHPDFHSLPNEEVELPEPVVMDRSYRFPKAKNFLNDWLPILLGDRPGYTDIVNKPLWWIGPWQSINSGGFTRDDLVRLIMAVYKEYATAIDEDSVVWTDIEVTTPNTTDTPANETIPVVIADAVFPVVAQVTEPPVTAPWTGHMEGTDGIPPIDEAVPSTSSQHDTQTEVSVPNQQGTDVPSPILQTRSRADIRRERMEFIS